MNKVILVLVLVCGVQPAFAQEMNVWRTESSLGAGDSGRGGGGNQIDSRVRSVSQAVNRANVGKAPGVKVRPWLRGVMNGSSDSSGEVLVVSRTRHSDLVDNRNPAKLKVKRLPKHAQSNAMGKTHVSADGKVALVADEGTRQQIVELATGRVLAEGRASGSRFVGQSTIYWWVEMQAQGRVNYRNAREGVNGSWSAGDMSCELTRFDWRGGEVEKIALTDCDAILSVSKDGKSALLGNQVEVQSLLFGGHSMIEKVYGELVRIDLETLERTVLANGQFLKPVMSDDLSVVCSSDPDTMYAAGDAIVTCYRNGRRIEHRLTAPAEAEITRRSVSVSPDGKYFSIWMQAGFREPLMPYKGLSYVQELGVGGEPLLTISDVGTTTWLPGDRRVVFTPIFGPGILYDYKAGWRAMLGGREDEQVNVIVLGERDDRFLLGQERAGTRDMMFVTVGSDVK